MLRGDTLTVILFASIYLLGMFFILRGLYGLIKGT
jgi:hypothetical protein